MPDQNAKNESEKDRVSHLDDRFVFEEGGFGRLEQGCIPFSSPGEYTITAFANDNELVALCRTSPSELGELDELALATRAANVLAAANARKTELATLCDCESSNDPPAG